MSLIRKHGAVLQAWACLDLVLPYNTVICGHSYCWNDEQLVTGISLKRDVVKSNKCNKCSKYARWLSI